MLQQAQKMGVVSKSTSLVAPAACAHTYSSWETIDSWYELPPTFGKCYILVQYQMRYCTKCNTAFAHEKNTQLSHSWRGNSTHRECTRCGLVEGIAR